jgi:hypothetical protein
MTRSGALAAPFRNFTKVPGTSPSLSRFGDKGDNYVFDEVGELNLKSVPKFA